MKSTPDMPPDSPDSLSRLLAAWRLAPPRNPRFRSAVWERLERTRTAPTWTGYVRAHAAMVAGTLVMAIALGAVAGRGQARARVAAESRQLAASYVDSLDARSMRMP